MVSNRSRASWVVLALLGSLLGLGLATAAPASAAVREVLLDASIEPRAVSIKAGDVVRFIVPAGEPEHRVVSTKAEGQDPNWPTEDGNYDSGPIAAGAFVDTPAFPAGTYTFEDRRSAALPPSAALPRTVLGSVTATRATAGPAPSRSPTAKPSPGAGSRPTSGPSAQPTGSPASPVPIGGGTGVLPPLSGGFSVPTLPPSAPGLGPQVAPTLAGEEPSLTPEEQAEQAEQVAVRAGRLPQGSTDRFFGTLAALGAVAALGTASLLIRLLLAHPAARPTSAATVD